MNKLFAFLSLLRKGSALSKASAWKQHQVNANMLAGVLAALVMVAKAFGYDIPLSNEDMAIIGGAILAVVNAVLTMISNHEVGLPEKKDAMGYPELTPNSVSDAPANDVPTGSINQPEDGRNAYDKVFNSAG